MFLRGCALFFISGNGWRFAVGDKKRRVVLSLDTDVQNTMKERELNLVTLAKGISNIKTVLLTRMALNDFGENQFQLRQV